MGTINANTTIAEARAAYLANCSYAEDGSLSMARAFESAILALQMLQPKKSTSGGGTGESVEFDQATMSLRLSEVRTFIAAMAPPEDGGAGVVYASLENFRS